MAYTVICADDHEIIRYGLCLLLDSDPDIEIMGQAATGDELLALLQTVQPQFLLLDLTMPGPSGVNLIRTLRADYPHIKIIVLSMHKTDAYVLESLRAGAAGYVLKEADASEVIQAIHEVAQGRRFLSPSLQQRVLNAFANGRDRLGAETLTPREHQVLELAAQGFTNIEIGKQLFISTRTAETHRAHGMQKLGLHNHTQLVRYFIDAELRQAPQKENGQPLS